MNINITLLCKQKIVYKKDKYTQPQKVPQKDLSGYINPPKILSWICGLNAYLKYFANKNNSNSNYMLACGNTFYKGCQVFGTEHSKDLKYPGREFSRIFQEI